MNTNNNEVGYDFEAHWNNAYRKTPTENLGWYERDPLPSLELIAECNLGKDARIFNAGAGSSTLINKLLKQGYTQLIVNDIASASLGELRRDLEIPNDADVQFIVDDLTNPSELQGLKKVDLWHDRAVLHFFTEKQRQERYFELINRCVKVGGFVILAEFNLEGAKKCCGLDVVNYNSEMLQERLGKNFELIKEFNYTYIQPSGNKRSYVYTLFQKTH